MESPILTITPDKTLEFETTPGVQTSVTLRLENPHDKNVAFKIKTTAPKSYLVKPSTGVITARDTQQINIHLVPQFEPKPTSSDRFLIQSCFVSSAEPITRDAWTTIPKNRLDERKLSVVINLTNSQYKGSAGIGSSAGLPGGAGLAPNSVAAFSAKPVPDDFESLKTHFDELLAVAVSLERQVKELSAMNGGAGASNASNSKGQAGTGAVELWQVAIILSVVIAVLKLVRFL